MNQNLDQLLKAVAAHTSLGHAKRDNAFLRQIENLCTHPGGTGAGSSNSLPEAMSAYRFAANEAVDLSSLREARLATALVRTHLLWTSYFNSLKLDLTLHSSSQNEQVEGCFGSARGVKSAFLASARI
jgi:hypothetical protein